MISRRILLLEIKILSKGKQAKRIMIDDAFCKIFTEMQIRRTVMIMIRMTVTLMTTTTIIICV
jgi:hypothetical protein